MSAAPGCPRCSGVVKPPDLWSSEWRCERHGAVHPYTVSPRVSTEAVEHLVARAAVPVWAPVPLLPGWTVTGLSCAGDDRTRSRATALALSGPSPIGGPADLVLVAEEMGVGLGARIAGVAGPDPVTRLDAPPDAKVEAAGHPTALWRCESADDRMAFAGEAKGVWLCAVLWPPAAELVLLEHLKLLDLRDTVAALPDLPFGASTTHLTDVVDA